MSVDLTGRSETPRLRPPRRKSFGLCGSSFVIELGVLRFKRTTGAALVAISAVLLVASEVAAQAMPATGSRQPAASTGMTIEMQVGSPIARPAIPGQISLRPGRPGETTGEQWELFMGQRTVRNVTTATLTPVLPERAKATGAAMVVAPGGAFLYLGIDSEGFDVARRLAAKGIAAFVLKYRTVPTPRDPHQHLDKMLAMLNGLAAQRSKGVLSSIAGIPEAVEDGQAAVRLVRSRAAEWRIDPARVGMIGFSAGAIAALKVAIAPDIAARPDFVASIYGPADIGDVPTDAPPLFAAMAMDDQYASAKNGGLLTAWARAGRPVEAHFHESGGHGFSSEAVRKKYFAELFSWMEFRKLTSGATDGVPAR
jgi:acetyl esterase/lipase